MLDELKSVFVGACAIAIPIVLFATLTLFLSSYDNSFMKVNRYTNCIENQSEIGKLTYDEMKEVCNKYLE